MVSWSCSYCGGRVYGFEGERGRYVGMCKHCGQCYGLSRGTDRETRVKYRLNKEIARLEKEAYRSYANISDDQMGKWYINKVYHNAERTPEDDIQQFDRKMECTFREALDHAQALSKRMDDIGWDAHIIVQIAYHTVAIFRNGERMPIYHMVASWTSTEDMHGRPCKMHRCVLACDYSIERTEAEMEDRIRKAKGTVTVEGPMSLEEYDKWNAERFRQQREKTIAGLEAEIRKQEGL